MRKPTLIGTNRPLLTLCTSSTPHTPPEVIHMNAHAPYSPRKVERTP
ncbi:hypothetical protein LP109_06395 [Moraxella bovis]|nr:hypothetical protein [Moraxella bovis]UZA17876.1 hypothetical protein LP109_06285 [Moraxella bovis]UZA17887.1 hypothetical protein LP109_06340 [Moraxella bovis]UZA17898.1 hypothetical protein LP109_06395 [Moraxella bovis]